MDNWRHINYFKWNNFLADNFENRYCYEKTRAFIIILALLSQLIYEYIAFCRLVFPYKIKDKGIIEDELILYGQKIITVFYGIMPPLNSTPLEISKFSKIPVT